MLFQLTDYVVYSSPGSSAGALGSHFSLLPQVRSITLGSTTTPSACASDLIGFQQFLCINHTALYISSVTVALHSQSPAGSGPSLSLDTFCCPRLRPLHFLLPGPCSPSFTLPSLPSWSPKAFLRQSNISGPHPMNQALFWYIRSLPIYFF